MNTRVAIGDGYSRVHREDLKQWMLALATTHQGDIPLFLQPLSGNTSDKESLVKTTADLHMHLKQADPQENPIYVADSGLYSAENMQALGRANVDWASRVPAHQQRSQSGSHPRRACLADERRWHTQHGRLADGLASGKGTLVGGTKP